MSIGAVDNRYSACLYFVLCLQCTLRNFCFIFGSQNVYLVHSQALLSAELFLLCNVSMSICRVCMHSLAFQPGWMN